MLKPSKSELGQYQSKGYFLRSKFFSQSEISEFRLRARGDLDRDLKNNKVMIKGDREGNQTLLKMWNSAEDNFYGFIARDERLVVLAQEILGDDVYIYSHKNLDYQ